jgi:hypothetical protein
MMDQGSQAYAAEQGKKIAKIALLGSLAGGVIGAAAGPERRLSSSASLTLSCGGGPCSGVAPRFRADRA